MRSEACLIIRVDTCQEIVALSVAELTRFNSKNLRRVLAALGKSGTGIPFKGHDVTGCQRLLQAGFALLQRKLRLSTFGDVDDRPREPQWLSLRVIEALAARDYPTG